MRRKSSGAAWLIGIVRWLRPAASALPAAVLRARPMRELTRCAADWIGLHNDLVSLAREAGYEGDANTSVRSIERLLRCSRAEAKAIVARLLNERMRQLERIAARELGPLCEELELDARARERVLAEAGALQSALAGHHAWSQRTGRYASGGAPAARRPLAGPLGLARSAKGLVSAPDKTRAR
jgi:germacradienol/geosmin synthase